ncbi:MAG: spermidine/putrescine ABC transporter substrate-binding protein [Thermus sp.]|uniref:polyamine ABC transporter substrate-binding protein n=1 Tax=Thermus sp. TaxID=275 RepID=UPI0025F62A54|nr:spermidine/putrescine ABC transporter substrate-binding protein [Thermus sp.]MCS7218554.1 spermidine/putrescine ABC transporter substrate-binding protein [Thermus sp.]MCX7849982.1 spermidine/putrescine ABC transporter substrate-binding protein [Thermus sp.]MDW8018286.1 spermidine/putrescine ABC transporter substrate-binding protein [Thermus sp.]
MNKVLAWLGVLLALALAQKGELRLFIWSEYIDPALLEAFTKQYGYRVRVDLYESNEEMIAKLQAGGVSQYDLIFPSDFYVPSLIQLRLVQPLDQARIPNLKNLDEKFKNPPFDPGNRYSAAYQWGTTGLIYRKDRVAAPPSWAVLFQEPKAPFVLMDSSREMLGIALRYLGFSVNTKNPKEVQQAGQVLLQAKRSRYFLGFEGGVGGKNRVVAGAAAYAVVYNGDAVRAADEYPDRVGFAIPKEGATLWVDSMMIPARAPNPEAAHRFINFILEPKVGAQLSNFNRYATPNKAALAYINPTDRKNPAIYPSAEAMKRLEFILDLGKDNRLYDEVWTAVKSR